MGLKIQGFAWSMNAFQRAINSAFNITIVKTSTLKRELEDERHRNFAQGFEAGWDAAVDEAKLKVIYNPDLSELTKFN